ncbi:MAG: helix-turn-helix transcriptional regulator [Candidatus Nanopelagicales bacterium]|jgi:transcriptional regulator with XRE-family HTH domain
MSTETFHDLLALYGDTQEALAKASGVGSSTISEICRGQRPSVQARTLGALAAALEKRVEGITFLRVRSAILRSAQERAERTAAAPPAP